MNLHLHPYLVSFFPFRLCQLRFSLCCRTYETGRKKSHCKEIPILQLPVLGMTTWIQIE